MLTNTASNRVLRTCSKPLCSLCCEPVTVKLTDEAINSLSGVHIGSARKINGLNSVSTTAFWSFVLHHVETIFIFN